VELIARRGIAASTSRRCRWTIRRPTTMLARGETVGVFQVESRGMRKALVEMKADRFEDIIALVALYRPGPMANIPTYCAPQARPGEGRVSPSAAGAGLSETHGIIVYQEQVMQAAQALSGYSLGEADLLRRAMGKKIKAEMDKQRERFVSGASSGHPQGRRRTRSSTCSPSSPTTASTRAMRPPMPSSPTRPPISRRITRSSSWRRR
jgi:DNA polymerase-3 subunit alpha